jgi:DASH complex subunit DAD3
MEPTESITPSASALTASVDDLSPLEQDVLDEYERLAENMKKVPAPPDLEAYSNLILWTHS